MKTIWHRVTRLLHPITLAVILIGVAGFLLGLIIAVERQDAAVVVAPSVDVGAASRIARLETALARRETEVAELQAELVRQRAEPPTPTVDPATESRIAGLEAALADSTAELNALQSELNGLAGQLAEAIQTRDELRAQIERMRLDVENERASLVQTIADLRRQLEAAEARANERARLEQTIADLRRQLEAAEARANERTRLEQTIADLRRQLEAAEAPAPEPVVAAPSAPVEPAQTQAEAPAPEPAVAAPSVPVEPTQTQAEETAPAEPSRADTESPDPQSAAVPLPAGPITQGIQAYRAADYRKAYEHWLPEALKGSSRAQFFVGALYYEGRGVAADRVLAYMWLRAATKANDPGAIKLLDRVREGMSGPELAEAETRIANGETIPTP